MRVHFFNEHFDCKCYVQTQGILIGFNNLDAVIHIIREASSNSIAAAGLRNGELLI